jgi:tetratricopeptide (TPR) repeat protein
MALAPLAACVAGITVSFIKKDKMVLFALASGLIAITPVSGFIPIGVVFAVRFLLIPSFFFILFIGAVLERFESKRFSSGGLNITPAAAVISPLIVIYAAVTFMRVPAWRDDATLMQSVLDKEPESALAHFIMGNALASKGRESEAFGHYEKALLYRPEYPEAEFNLGILEQRRGNIRVAERRYRKAIELKPEFRPARTALVNILVQTGRPDEARRLLDGN